MIRTSVAPVTLRTNPGLFSLVLGEVLENALVHAGTAPTVTVDIAWAGAEVRVRVVDDGPGIPESEVEPVVSGDETALEHASSLGLWIIYWGAQTLDGTVEFETTGDGSEVTLFVPDQASD